MKPSWWRVAILPLALTNCVVGLIAIIMGVGMQGLGGLILKTWGVLLGPIGLCAIAWAVVLPRRSPRVRTIVSSIVLLIAISPWMLLGYFNTFDPNKPERIEMQCFDPYPVKDYRKIGGMADGTLASWPLLRHDRNVAYLIPQPAGEARQVAVDCVSEDVVFESKYCRPENMTEEELLEALDHLPTCPKMPGQ
jgi:hypothetical protein